MSATTFLCSWHENIFIAVHSEENPGATEWTEGVAVWKNGQSEQACMLVLSRGGGPNVNQRDELKRATVAGEKHKIALLTTSTAIRLVGTAIKWFMPRTKILAPEQIDEALQFFDITPASATAVKAEVARMSEELSRLRTPPA